MYEIRLTPGNVYRIVPPNSSGSIFIFTPLGKDSFAVIWGGPGQDIKFHEFEDESVQAKVGEEIFSQILANPVSGVMAPLSGDLHLEVDGQKVVWPATFVHKREDQDGQET
jgi:hypothetical protein